MSQNIFDKINNNSYNIHDNKHNKQKLLNKQEKGKIFVSTFIFTIVIMMALTICSICSEQIWSNNSLSKDEKLIKSFFIIAQNFVPSIITFVGALIISNIIESLRKKRVSFVINLITLILLFPYVIFYMTYTQMKSDFLLINLIIIITILIVLLSLLAYNELDEPIIEKIKIIFKKIFKKKGS